MTKVPTAWALYEEKAIIIPLYKGKGSRQECGNCREIMCRVCPFRCIFLDLYGRVLIQSLIQVAESKVAEKQSGFRRGRGFVDPIYVAEKYVGKEMKLYTAIVQSARILEIK